jgi:signal transduction histidine kinase
MKLEDFSHEIQAAFREDDRKIRINNSIGGCWLAITLMPAGFTLDYFVYPEHLWFFLKLRLFCSLAVAVVLVLFYTPIGKKYYLLLGQIWYLLPAFFISWMIYASEGASSSYYAGLNIVLLAVGLMLPWTYQENLMGGLLVMAMYLGACSLHGSLILKGVFFNNLYFLFLTDIIVVTGSYFQGQLRLREFVLRFELDKNRKMLEESNRKLVELDQMKSRFFANISHELRTPLTLLIAPLETLQREKLQLLDSEARNALQAMQGNAMRLLKLINDLLDLAKLESGRMEVKREPVLMEEFLKGLIQAIQGHAKDKRILLSTKVDPSIGVVLIDRDKLEKITLNLLFNALKFTSGGGKVELTADKVGTQLVLQVKDTGIGILGENLPFIFDRFWQVDSASNRKYQGTGIGLALVKELTEVQGGAVSVESQVSKGTTMTVRLPFEEAPALSAEEKKRPVISTPTAVEPEEWLTKLYRRAELFPALTPLSDTLPVDNYRSSQKPKLLLADDEPDMLKFLKSQLHKHYEVIEATDGLQALAKVKQFLPDLVLLDMMMPEKDGIEVCRELKGTISTQSIPVIMLTARADDETKLSALSAGASDFLTKPFSTAELYVRVKNLVESHQLQLDLVRKKTALESTLEQLKETEGQLVQNEKMASLGRLSAGIIHEINNPLNYAGSALHLLKLRQGSLPEVERQKYLEIVSDIEDGIGRVQKIVSDLRTFTHPNKSGIRDLVGLEDAVLTAVRFLSHELKENIKVQVDISRDQTVVADRNMLIHVFVNLIQNSVDALKEKKFINESPLLSIKSRQENDMIYVTMRDNGTGISEENLDKIFDPFFTTKDVGAGMGLGLSICYKIIREQGGEISVKSKKGQFTEFVLELPSKA